jgi:Protein of unknown function (DUF2587)
MPEDPEVVLTRRAEQAPTEEGETATKEAVQHPAKVMRIGTMVRQLLDEVRHAPLDEASRNRLKEVYETSLAELSEVLSPELRDELAGFTMAFGEGSTPTDAELRVAHAQLVGWLEGLFHGIQATLLAQQMESRAQFEELRRRSLPSPGQDSGTPGQYI